MKRFFIISIICSITVMSVHAQTTEKAGQSKDWRMGVSIMPGVATNAGYGFVLGFDARLQTMIADNTAFILTTGLTEFFGKGNTSAMGYIPLKVGAKYYFDNNLYAGGEIGIGFGTVKNTGRSFIWSPTVGLAFHTVDVSVKYEDAPGFTFANGIPNNFTKQFALRVAYSFSLK